MPDIAEKSDYFYVDLDQIDTNAQQPRKYFDQDELRGLASSIAVDGVLQPIVVAPNPSKSGRYIVVAGERRLRASKLAGLERVPVVLKQTSKNDALRLALVENIQRQNLNILEEAAAYETLINEVGLTQEECAAVVGKDRSTVANALRVLRLPKELYPDLEQGKLTQGHARALLSLGDRNLMIKAREIIVKKEMSVREAEFLVKRLKAGGDREVQAQHSDLDYIEERIRARLRTRVRIVGTAEKGKIEISYFSQDELERLMAVLA